MTLPGNATERVIEGLSANTEYQMTIYATSAMGNGPINQFLIPSSKYMIK